MVIPQGVPRLFWWAGRKEGTGHDWVSRSYIDCDDCRVQMAQMDFALAGGHMPDFDCIIY